MDYIKGLLNYFNGSEERKEGEALVSEKVTKSEILLEKFKNTEEKESAIKIWSSKTKMRDNYFKRYLYNIFKDNIIEIFDDEEETKEDYSNTTTAVLNKKGDRVNVTIEEQNGRIKVKLLSNDELEQEKIKKRRFLFNLLKSNPNGVKVKLCLSKIDEGDIMNRSKNFLVPALNMVGFLPDFGFLHSFLIIGGFKYEW